MVWRALAKTIQALVFIAGLTMEIFGVYSDVVQATEAPKGPFGLALLTWGAVLVTTVSMSVIFQLWLRLNKFEDSFKYAFNVEVVSYVWLREKYALSISVKNYHEKPLSYELQRVDLRITGMRASISRPAQQGLVRGNQSVEWAFEATGNEGFPGTFPIDGDFEYTVRYGPSGGAMRFEQHMTFGLLIEGNDKKTRTTWTLRSEDISSLHQGLIRKSFRRKKTMNRVSE